MTMTIPLLIRARADGRHDVQYEGRWILNDSFEWDYASCDELHRLGHSSFDEITFLAMDGANEPTIVKKMRIRDGLNRGVKATPYGGRKEFFRSQPRKGGRS